MTAPHARRARFDVECLEGRAMMSATLAAPVPEPVELRYELENVLISSYQTSAGLAKVGPGTLVLANANTASGHALYQDIFIPANQSGGTHGTGGGGGAGKVQMQDFHFVMRSAAAGEIEIESFSWGESPSLLPAVQKVRDAAQRTEGDEPQWVADFAGVDVGGTEKGQKTAGYDLKTAKKV